MDILKARIELRRTGTRNLFELALNHKVSNCLIGGRSCGFHLPYKGSSFCISEIIGQSCQVEKLKKVDQSQDEEKGATFSLPFLQKMDTDLLLAKKKSMEFKVYHRDRYTHSTVFLGRIIERRRKEREDNLKDLLNKAIKQYSNQRVDRSTMFLIEG